MDMIMKSWGRLLLMIALVLFGQRGGASDPTQTATEPNLFTRVYRVEISFSDLRQLMQANQGETNGQILQRYLKEKGVDLYPPSTLFYTVGERALLVRSTKENLEKLDTWFTKRKKGK